MMDEDKDIQMNDELEVSILFLKYQGLSDSCIRESLKKTSKEIEEAFLNLQTYGFIDRDGLLTDEGIDYIQHWL